MREIHAEQGGFESLWTFEQAIVPLDYASKYPYGARGVRRAIAAFVRRSQRHAPVRG